MTACPNCLRDADEYGYCDGCGTSLHAKGATVIDQDKLNDAARRGVAHVHVDGMDEKAACDEACDEVGLLGPARTLVLDEIRARLGRGDAMLGPKR